MRRMKMDKQLRRSHGMIKPGFVTKDDYPGLSEELKEFNYYYHDQDTGHVLMAIPEVLLNEALENGDLDLYEVPIPVKYVLEKGYRIFKNHLLVEAEYDMTFGVMIPEKYVEI